MSIPLDRLYHYIQYVAEQVREDNVLIYRFFPHGSKNIKDLTPLDLSMEYFPKNASKPQIICNDQEPLDYEFYQLSDYDVANHRHETEFGTRLEFTEPQNLRTYTNNIYDKCLLLHSEKRSVNLEKYKNSHFIPVYHWSHAIIARDWFRYAEYIDIQVSNTQKQFLIYNRAWAGTREYRLKFVELLQQHNLVNDCQTSFNPIDPEHNVHYTDHVFKNTAFAPDTIQDVFPVTSASSQSSADFTIEDYANTKFEVVLETLFDDERIQLTEKILRPIACGHPFILASTKGSLEYLREYGFKTFDGIIDETYDTEQDPVKRLHLIINTMKTIATWTEEEQTLNWAKINEITKHNKQHFFSTEFFELVVNELKYNFKLAFDELEDTNTSKDFIDFRKKYYVLPEVNRHDVYIKKRAEVAHVRQDVVRQLTKARYYYNRYLKTLD
jgi:hypothetical protein